MTFEEARKKLVAISEKRYASEEYHITFDELIEERLMQLDPEFMKAMLKVYDESGMSRWYA